MKKNPPPPDVWQEIKGLKKELEELTAFYSFAIKRLHHKLDLVIKTLTKSKK